MGTVASTSRKLQRLLPELPLVFDAAAYRVRDAGHLRTVQLAIEDPSFAHQNAIIRIIAEEAEGLRGFCRGCPCHPEECLAAARKASVFRCPASMKGAVGPYIEERLEQSFLRWGSLAGTLPATAFGGWELQQELAVALNNMIGLTQYKFNFLQQLPWAIWKAQTPAGMACARRLYEASMRDELAKRRVHRVAHLFFEPGGPLAAQVDHYVACGELLPELRVIKESYDRAPWDEIHAEGIHRDATHVRNHGPAYETAGLAARMRLQQNLSFVQGLAPRDMQRLCARFHAPRLLLRRRGWRRRMVAPEGQVIQGKKAVTAWIYRLGSVAVADWKLYNIYLQGPQVLSLQARKSLMQEMRVDFFSKVLRNGDLVTIAHDREDRADKVVDSLRALGLPGHPPCNCARCSFPERPSNFLE
jgi:hypothetical protein